MSVLEIAKKVKLAAKEINLADGFKKDEILKLIKQGILQNKEEILKANELDVENAKKSGLRESLIKRLSLDDDKIKNMISSLEEVIFLKDPVGEITGGHIAKNGLKIEKVRVSLGVVGIIYEARPNVTLEAASLCIKSGNAVILRGGKEAIKTNSALVKIIKKALKESKISEDVVGFIEDVNRNSAVEMMKLNGFLDVLIPRGGKCLIEYVVKNATVPLIETGVGNCHIYVDEFADLKMAVKIVVNAKVSNPSVCNAAESLVVHEAVAKDFLNELKKEFDDKNVEIVGCEKTVEILKNIKQATEEDFYCEYLGLKISVKVVSNFEEAICVINKYSTKHSEAIITSNYFVAEQFLKLIDSSAVYVNASTRFTDGREFGLGAEIGISTQKLHARGPMGLRALTCEKYLIKGDGQIR